MRAPDRRGAPRSPRAGFALVELVVVLALTLVVAGGAYRVLLGSQRYYRLLAATLEVHQAERAALEVLAAELRELDPAGGDILAAGADSITIRAARLLAFACAPADAAGRVVVRDSLIYAFRAADPSRDRIRVFREGDPDRADDDAWPEFGLVSVQAGQPCADGAPGTALELDGPPAALDSVSSGAPVRAYERVTYRLYADGGGEWWLGVREYAGGRWAAISPVAGPLEPRTGLALEFLDAAGAVTAEPARIARIELVVRGLSGARLPAAGGAGRLADSLRTSVQPRNVRREGGAAP